MRAACKNHVANADKCKEASKQAYQNSSESKKVLSKNTYAIDLEKFKNASKKPTTWIQKTTLDDSKKLSILKRGIGKGLLYIR